MWATFLPAMKISPDVGISRIPSWFIIVDLPEPDGPMSATNSPSLMSSVIWLSAVKSPLSRWYTFDTSANWIRGVPFMAFLPSTFLKFCNNPFPLHPDHDTGYDDNPSGNDRIIGTD